MVGTGRQHAGSGSLRGREGNLFVKPQDLALKYRNAVLNVVVGVRHSGRSYAAESAPHSHARNHVTTARTSRWFLI